MTYHGMGQALRAAVPTAWDWASIERFARDAAGPTGMAAWFVRPAHRARHRARAAAALVTLQGTAVGNMARSALSRPSGFSEGLLAIADYARRQRGTAPAHSRPAPAHSRPAPVATPVAHSRPMPVAPSRPNRTSADIIAHVRAELAKPPSAWHHDMAPMVQLADRAIADRGALREFLTQMMSYASGDGRAALAVLVVRLEQADTARGGVANNLLALLPGGPPSPSVPPPSVPPSQGGSTSADAGWAAYQASEGARTPGVHPTRAQHDRFWSSLTTEEKLAGLRFYALTQEQVASIRPEQDPSLATFFGKMMSFAFSLMSAASQPEQSSDGQIRQSSQSSDGPIRLGNYY